MGFFSEVCSSSLESDLADKKRTFLRKVKCKKDTLTHVVMIHSLQQIAKAVKLFLKGH